MALPAFSAGGPCGLGGCAGSAGRIVPGTHAGGGGGGAGGIGGLGACEGLSQGRVAYGFWCLAKRDFTGINCGFDFEGVELMGWDWLRLGSASQSFFILP